MAADALQRAIGTYKLRSMADYLFSEDEFAEDQTGPFAGTVRAHDMAPEGQDF